MHQESASALSSSSSSIWGIMNSWFSPSVLFVLLNLIIGTIAYTSSSLTNQKHNKLNQQPKVSNSQPSLLQRLKSIISFQANHQLQSQQSQGTDNLFPSEKTVQKPAFTHDSHCFQENLHSQVQYIFSHTHEPNYHETPAPFVSAQKGSFFDDFQLPHEEKVLESDINLSESQEENDQETLANMALDGKDSIFGDFKPTQEQKGDGVNTRLKSSNVIRTKSDIGSLQSSLGHNLEAEDTHIVEARRPKTARERGSSKVTDGDAEVDSKADDFINKFKHQLKLQRMDSIVRHRGVIARGSGDRVN